MSGTTGAGAPNDAPRKARRPPSLHLRPAGPGRIPGGARWPAGIRRRPAGQSRGGGLADRGLGVVDAQQLDLVEFDGAFRPAHALIATAGSETSADAVMDSKRADGFND